MRQQLLDLYDMDYGIMNPLSPTGRAIRTSTSPPRWRTRPTKRSLRAGPRASRA